MDLFSLASNDYLPRYTYPDLNPRATLGYGFCQDGDGNIWTQWGYRFDVTAKTFSKPGNATLIRHGAYDSVRNRIFGIWHSDNNSKGTPSDVTARELDPTTGDSRDITINASAAYTQFQNDRPVYVGMAFCPIDGKFYLMNPGRIGTLYVITPNSGTAWDMNMWTPSGGTWGVNGSLCKRLLWVPALTGFVVQDDSTKPLKFLRMA